MPKREGEWEEDDVREGQQKEPYTAGTSGWVQKIAQLKQKCQ
jgi:hypothetical protein